LSSQSDTQSPRHPEWQRHVRAFEEIRNEARRQTQDLSEQQARWRPEPGRWSVADCLEHLNATWEQYIPRLERTIAEAQEARDPEEVVPASFSYGFLGNFMIRMLEPPPKIRVRAPRAFVPVSGELPFEEIRDRFEGFHDEAIRLIDASRGLHLQRVRLTSPLSRLVRLSLGQWFDFLAAHERRHLWQAHRVRQSAGFPEP